MKTNPLKKWFDREEKKPGFSQAQFARDIGVEWQTVWNWLTGHSKPAGEHIHTIHKRTKIPVDVLTRWISKNKEDHDDL